MTVKKGGPALLRKTADRLYKEVQERVRAINADPTEPLCITEGLVFGSYINEPEKERPNDLDIALTVEERYKGDKKRSTEMQYARWNELIQRHPSYANLPFAYVACCRDVIIRIRKNSKYIQITNISNDLDVIEKSNYEYFDVGEIAMD